MATTRDQGTVVEVSSIQVGDEVVRDHATGETTLFLSDVADFDDDGGQISIEGVVYTYTSKDDDASTLTIPSPGLSAAVPDDTQIYVYPLAYEKWATVIVEDGEDAVLARIPMSMEANVDDGVRDDSEQESATVVLRGNEWEVADIIGISDNTRLGGGAKYLDDLLDVDAPAGAVADRQGLHWDAASASWKPYGPIVRQGTGAPPTPASSYAWQFYVKHV